MKSPSGKENQWETDSQNAENEDKFTETGDFGQNKDTPESVFI